MTGNITSPSTLSPCGSLGVLLSNCWCTFTNLLNVVGIGPKHSKRHKTVSKEISAGVAGVLVDFFSENQKGQK